MNFLLSVSGVCPHCVYRFVFTDIESTEDAENTVCICPKCGFIILNKDRKTQIPDADYQDIRSLKEVKVC